MREKIALSAPDDSCEVSPRTDEVSTFMGYGSREISHEEIKQCYCAACCYAWYGLCQFDHQSQSWLH